MKQNKRTLGGSYEAKAAAFLQEKGLQILERNFRCRTGEVDLIAKDGKYLVFVEVKYRRYEISGGPLDAVDRHKQRMICKVAEYYLLTHGHSFDIPCRFDVIGFEQDRICWVRDAFEYIR